MLFFGSCFGLDARRTKTLFLPRANITRARQSYRLQFPVLLQLGPLLELGPPTCESHSPLPCRAVRLSPEAPLTDLTTAVSLLAGAAGDV